MTAAIIAAGGQGVRMNAGVPKQYIEVNSKPIIAYTLEAFENCESIDTIVLTAPKDFMELSAEIAGTYHINKLSRIVEGGATRQQSVYKAIVSLSDTDIVLVHDGARPLVSKADIDASVEGARAYGSCTIAVPVKYTMKLCKDGFASETLPREALWQIQTPQGFQYSILKAAHERAKSEHFEATDDTTLVERLGHPTRIIPGSDSNIKITTKTDLQVFSVIASGHEK
jgi:2-C-methyl-D-erythritol 4-phosphate cytidylyltransferase